MWQILDFAKDNWGELTIAVLALVKVVIRLTPTLSDDKVFGLLDKFLESFVPNLKKD